MEDCQLANDGKRKSLWGSSFTYIDYYLRNKNPDDDSGILLETLEFKGHLPICNATRGGESGDLAGQGIAVQALQGFLSSAVLLYFSVHRL